MLFRVKQQICVHVDQIRCLVSNPSGRYHLRFFIYERTPTTRKYAVPVNVIQLNSVNQPQYELGDNHYDTRQFLMKGNSNTKIQELCVFKIQTNLFQNEKQGQSSYLQLVCQLIQSDYGSTKVVGVFEGKIVGNNVKQCLMIDFYDYSASQVLGTIHSCSYQFQFCPNMEKYPSFQSFCQTQTQQYVEQLLAYFYKQSKKTQQHLSNFQKHINAMSGNFDVLDSQQNAKFDFRLEELNKFNEPLKTEKIIQQLSSESNTQQEVSVFDTESIVKKTQCQSVSNKDDIIKPQKRKRRKIFGNPRKSYQEPIKNRTNVSIEEFEKLLHESSSAIYEKWKQIIGVLMSETNQLIFETYHLQYQNKIKKLMGESVIRFKGSWDVDHYSNEEAQRNQMASQIRSMSQQNQIYTNQFKFYNKNFYSKNRPIYFEEGAISENHLSGKFDIENSQQNHIIFLVHGLGACRLDLEKLKIQLKRYYPNRANIVISTANQGRTQGNIETMGLRLASEVSHHLSKDKKYKRISFIGHSMGGVIIRSALPKLEAYSSQFYSLITLSSPHIGYNYSNSKLVDAGIWVINNWQKCQSILQLTLSDHENQQQCFLYSLSLCQGLQWFKKIALLGSHQDSYVPYYSARIQKHDECIQDQKRNKSKGIIHNRMIDNILNQIKCSLTRVDVNFSIKQQNIDNLIGRTAHINFIQNVEMLRIFVLMGESLLF